MPVVKWPRWLDSTSQVLYKNWHRLLTKTVFSYPPNIERFWDVKHPPNKKCRQNQTGNKVRLAVRDFAGVKMLVLLVRGWTNPFEKYARQIGSFPQVGMNIKRYLKPPTRLVLGIANTSINHRKTAVFPCHLGVLKHGLWKIQLLGADFSAVSGVNQWGISTFRKE